MFSTHLSADHPSTRRRVLPLVAEEQILERVAHDERP